MRRYEVPVDDRAHVRALSHSPVAVAAIGSWPSPLVEFWCEHTDGPDQGDCAFQVFGTGHPLPDGATWVGTCPRKDGMVWHLYEVTRCG